MKKLCFVIMGYGKKTDFQTGKTYDLDKTYQNIIKPAVINAGFECIRGDEIKESGLIDKSMYGLLIYSELVIADITTFNPNAVYELGIRHAARPYSTIILKDNENKIPFDLNHNKIFHYSHLGDDISATEAARCQKELTALIKSIDGKKTVDSPLFEYMTTVKPYKLPEEEYTSIIKDLADKEKHLFAFVEQAKKEMTDNNFSEAAKLWNKAHKKVENEPYYIQQRALCTYKSKQPSELAALNEALQIITKLEPENKSTNDPETLGIMGAINKRLWLISVSIEYLDKAIEYYGKGFKVNSDYYTGENYAICLDLKAQIEDDKNEKLYYKIEAKKTREAIVKIIELLLEEEESKKRNDIKWIYATRANCAYAFGNQETFEKFKNKFFDNLDADWEKQTFEKGIEHLDKCK